METRFEVGDKVRVRSNGHVGTVLAVTYRNSIALKLYIGELSVYDEKRGFTVQWE